jgi:hypothetical protein
LEELLPLHKWFLKLLGGELDEAITFLTHYKRLWTQQFDRLDDFIHKGKKEELQDDRGKI